MQSTAVAPLLPFHESILSKIVDPATSELLILARGLGLRRIVCTLLKIYDSPQSLVLLVNATPEEEGAIGEELGIMGCRKPGLRIVGYELGKKDRQALYSQGGIMSVTSRILVVDMLQSDIPIDIITGIIVLHGDRVTALSLEAFIVRLYREKNQTGFLKAFSDQPEHITSGLSPLKNIMKELQLRTVHIYPRFQEDIKASLERRRADVVELYQPMTEAMGDIHTAIVQCMTMTLAELKRSNTTLDLDDLNVESAYFRSFDHVVRRQLDPVWHRVGPRTKQLTGDLGVLRKLLTYLLTYDALAFHAYLETLVAAHSGTARQHRPPWMLTDAADVIFTTARRRCYTLSAPPSTTTTTSAKSKAPPARTVDEEHNEAFAILDEMNGERADAGGKEREGGNGGGRRKKWLPEGIDPVLEELPKWTLLAEVLQEIEEELMRQEGKGIPSGPPTAHRPGSDIVLIMCAAPRTADLLREFLAAHDPAAPRGAQGRAMMERKLRLYLWWKAKLAERKAEGRAGFGLPNEDTGEGSVLSRNAGSGKGREGEVSEALRRKDRERRDRAAGRRRVRGGAPAGTGSGGGAGAGSEREARGEGSREMPIDVEAESIADFLTTQAPDALSDSDLFSDADFALLDDTFDAHYGLLAPQQTVLVRAYADDADDVLLWELQPRFVVMFEPSQEFVRRVEVYRSLSPGLAVRVYFMVYATSCEEHKYLAGIRREKESFERMIKERATMLLPIFEGRSASSNDAIIKTISSRMAGGRKELSQEPARVIVDMREFRSTLPSLLHASKLQVIPATLTVGDYILTPDMCVERKSIPDLISSFNSGRLYTQCELMSVHYKQPILLIEFEEHKSFSLETVSDVKSFVKSTSKYPVKNAGASDPGGPAKPTIQSKLVLLTLTFPRVRIIWSSSPHATADIFNDLKTLHPEPDPARAIAVGAEEDPDAGAGVNAAAEELLRALPGVSAKNVKYVMSRVGSVKRLCEMGLAEVQEVLGVEPGKACWEFMHRGDRKK